MLNKIYLQKSKMESFNCSKKEPVVAEIPKSHSTYLMSSFTQEFPRRNHEELNLDCPYIDEEGKDFEIESTIYNKYRRSVYKPSTKYTKLGFHDDEDYEEDFSMHKRGKSSSISHSSAYYRK